MRCGTLQHLLIVGQGFGCGKPEVAAAMWRQRLHSVADDRYRKQLWQASNSSSRRSNVAAYAGWSQESVVWTSKELPYVATYNEVQHTAAFVDLGSGNGCGKPEVAAAAAAAM
jgi:hypothetical protein